METGKSWDIAKSFQELYLNSNSNRTEKSAKNFASPLYSSFLQIKKPKPPSLVSLCLGVVGKNLEDIIEDLPEIASTFPSHIRMAIAAIAKRRKLLNDEILVALVESSWEILDISTSNVSDLGLSHVVKTCKALRAVDISQCNKLTSDGVSVLLQHSQSLEVLRWGYDAILPNAFFVCFILPFVLDSNVVNFCCGY